MNYELTKTWAIRNLANMITTVGIILCFIIQVVIYAYPGCTLVLLELASLVIATDWIDGPVARYFELNGYKGSVSDVGKFLDRFRDKDFQLTFFFFLIWHPGVGYHLKWAFSLLIVSEFILLATLFIGVKRKADVAAVKWGKWKMILECVTILACLANLIAQEHGMKALSGVTYVLLGIALVSLGFAIMSIKKHVADCCEPAKS